MRKRDLIQTVQYPHGKRKLRLITILLPLSNLPVCVCDDIETGEKDICLLKRNCFKPTGNHKIDLIKRIKLGQKDALKEYIKVYRSIPQFLKDESNNKD